MSVPSIPSRKTTPSFSKRIRRKAISFLVILAALPLLLALSSTLIAGSLLATTSEQSIFDLILEQPVFWAGLGISLLTASALIWLFIQVFIVPVENLSSQTEKLANGDWS